jgi:exonuclease SbcC
LAARATEVENAAAELETVRAQITIEEGNARTHSAAARTAEERLGELTDALKVCKQSITALENEKRDLAATAATADKLAGAKVRITELDRTRATIEADIADINRQLSETPEETFTATIPNVSLAEQALRLAEASARSAAADLAIARRSVDELRAVAETRASLEAEVIAFEMKAANWSRLADDINDLKALEIDAAGPGLSQSINDLLRTCIGPRWTVSVETTRMSADGKKQIEGCDVLVTDNLKGKVLTGEALSGGQKVIIGEAISLALSMMALKRAGITGATLVRDESGAALSPGYAPKYLAMLRKACEMVGASKILFVSHNPEAQELADSVVRINEDGTLDVVR